MSQRLYFSILLSQKNGGNKSPFLFLAKRFIFITGMIFMVDEKEQSENVIKMPLGNLMKKNYLDYAVSVIMDRALPDVRDGLKPVHRRILFAMNELNMYPTGAYKKSARMVGETMGKYHPHGDSSIYDAAVNMARPWTKLVPLIDGQGNYGSIDGDSPAAMRYTEMRLTRAGAAFFEDIKKETVIFRDNYDGAEQEPEVLPVSYPNIWVNGAEGIAVGMATYLPPHNLNETIDLTIALQENPNLSTEEILSIMPGPDFPTGGVVHNLSGFRDAILTGKGAVKVRAKWHSEMQKNGAELLIIDEIPYQVNKKELIETISEKASIKNGEFSDIADIHDESNKEGIRIVITLKKGAIPAVIFNRLVKRTKVEDTYNYNVMLLEGQSPKQMNLVQIITTFLKFRTEVITRRVEFDLREAAAHLHILAGLKKVLMDIDKAIALIRENKNAAEANEALRGAFEIDEKQAQAVLSLRLQRLTGMEIDSVLKEFNEVNIRVSDMKDILAKSWRIQEMVKNDLLSAKERFGQKRISEISYEDNTLDMTDLIKKEPCLIHLTKDGYLKRMPLDLMEAQNRKGKGRSSIQVSEGDAVDAIYSASTHDTFIVFTQSGQAMSNHVWTLPDGVMSGRGRHLRNIFETLDEKVASILIVPKDAVDASIITVTVKGKVKRTLLSEYTSTTRKKGVQGVGIEEGDSLMSVMLAKTYDHLLLVASNGKAARFEIDNDVLAAKGRKSIGVRGIRVAPGEQVISAMVIPGIGVSQVDNHDAIDEGKYLLCVGENGVGKRTSISEFTAHSRGTKGVTCLNINEKTGKIVKSALVTDEEDIIIATEAKTLRMHVSDIRMAGRNTAGTILMNVNAEKIIDIIQVPRANDEIEQEIVNENLEESNNQANNHDNTNTQAENESTNEQTNEHDAANEE